MFKLNFKNGLANCYTASLFNYKSLNYISKKTVVSSIYSKYVIIGGGFTGISLAKKLLSVLIFVIFDFPRIILLIQQSPLRKYY